MIFDVLLEDLVAFACCFRKGVFAEINGVPFGFSIKRFLRLFNRFAPADRRSASAASAGSSRSICASQNNDQRCSQYYLRSHCPSLY
jgi:hypothetical protein